MHAGKYAFPWNDVLHSVCVCVFVCCIEKYIHSCVHVQYINIYMQDCLYKHKSFLEPLGVVQFLKALGGKVAGWTKNNHSEKRH